VSGAWDVIVVGAGPAGSTAAASLAREGHRVLVLERDEFPRFHIGESLLPACLTVLDELGVRPSAAAFVHKAGAQFLDESAGRGCRFDFSAAMGGPPRFAYQVVRADFDLALRDAALAAGAEVRHGEQVRDVAIDEAGVRVTATSGAETARYLVDATGQDRLLARRHRSVAPHTGFGKAAIFTHFEGLSDAALAEIGPDGDIRVLIRPDGWAWLIPLAGRRLSVGVISRHETMEHALLEQLLTSSPITQRLIAGAARGDTKIIANFSYRNTAAHGPRYACIGDAACFLDPVFSSGVTLALVSGRKLAELLSAHLWAGTEHEADIMAPLAAHMDGGIDTFAALIHRFYNTRFVEHFFLDEPAGRGELVPGLTSILAGDVWRDDNPFQRMLLSSRRQPAAAS
jgi:flavin-dependent dehydrogenase